MHLSLCCAVSSGNGRTEKAISGRSRLPAVFHYWIHTYRWFRLFHHRLENVASSHHDAEYRLSGLLVVREINSIVVWQQEFIRKFHLRTKGNSHSIWCDSLAVILTGFDDSRQVHSRVRAVASNEGPPPGSERFAATCFPGKRRGDAQRSLGHASREQQRG